MHAKSALRIDIATFDEGAKGFLSRHELKCAVSVALGFRPHKFEVEQLVDDAGRVSYVNAETFIEQYAVTDDDMIKHIFEAMDVEARGFLTLSAIKQAFALASPSIKPEVVESAFAELDIGRTSMISYQQFVWIMRATGASSEGPYLVPPLADPPLLPSRRSSSKRETLEF